MTSELRLHNSSQRLYLHALSSAYRSGVQLYDPTLWLVREPELEEKMLRDADIAHAVGYRRHLIAGRQWNLLPARENDRSQVACMVGRQLIGGIKHFTQARMNLARAFFSGSRFAKIHGEPRTLTIGDGKPRTWWVPTRLEDLDKRMFRPVPDVKRKGPQPDGDELEHGYVETYWERWNVADSEWVPESMEDAITTIRHVYQDDQGTLGHGRGLREALGWWWYAKENTFAETLQAVERFSQGILTAKVNGIRDAASGRPNNELIAAWRSVLEELRSRNVVVYDADDQIEFVQMDGSGWQLLTDVRNELRTTITTLVLGANLTTSASEGGSYALAGIQENSTEALIQFDRETLEETLTDDLIGCVWTKNYANLRELGIAYEKPSFSIAQEKREEPSERAQTASILHGMGVDLSRKDLFDLTGFKMPEPGEDIIPGGSTAPATPGGGLFPFSKVEP